MKAAKTLALALILTLALSSSALAVDLTNRISFGFNNQLAFGVIGGEDSLSNAYLTNQSLSCKYWFTREIGVETLVGFLYSDFEEVSGWGLSLTGKFLYNLIYEKQLNVYTGGGLSIMPIHTDDGHDEETNTGFGLMAFVGTEFFFDGLPNLGFDMEVGLQYLDFDEYRQFGSYGGGFTTVGVRYYF